MMSVHAPQIVVSEGLPQIMQTGLGRFADFSGGVKITGVFLLSASLERNKPLGSSTKRLGLTCHTLALLC